MSLQYQIICFANKGIGKGIAIRLAQANASVTIVGRDEVNGAAIGIIVVN